MNDLIKNSKSVDYVKNRVKARMLKKSEILLSGIS